MFIPFDNYENENAPFKKQIENNIEAVVRLKSEYEHEKYIESFEKKFAEYNGSQYVLAVNSGTTALELALQASGIKKGDEVILPSYTYISTALAVSNLEAIPVFIDIKKDTLTLDPQKIEKKITRKTKMIIPVHIHGNPCEMNEIVKIAQKNKLFIVEDCSHAHGAEYNNKKVGNFGIGCFSCHTTKIFSGIGNSGLITINNKKTFEKIKNIICVKNDPNLSLSKRTPCKIDAMQAAILKAKLPHLEKIIERKKRIAASYIKNLPHDIAYQKEESNSKHVYRDFIALIDNRDELKNSLKTARVETKTRYMIPLHQTEYYRNQSHQQYNLPITNLVSRQALCLPASYIISNKEIQHICNLIKNNNYASKKK